MKVFFLQYHTYACIDVSYNLNMHIMIINIVINMSIVITIHLEMVEKQNTIILNAMCIFQCCFNIIFTILFIESNDTKK